MQGEDSGRQPLGSRSPAWPGRFGPEAPQHEREQAGRCRMQHDVGQVVSDDRIAPQFVLQPEGAVEHGIILLGGPELEPDPPQPMPRLEGRRGDVGGIVPEQSACEGRKVGQQGGGEERQRACWPWEARRARRNRRGAKREGEVRPDHLPFAAESGRHEVGVFHQEKVKHDPNNPGAVESDPQVLLIPSRPRTSRPAPRRKKLLGSGIAAKDKLMLSQ